MNKINEILIGDDTPGIIFNFTSSLLTLVGLIAIFVSLNTQHILQKVRELYWQMKSLKASFDINVSTSNSVNLDEITRSFYESLVIYRTLHKKDNIMSGILRVTKWSLIAVLIIWWITLALMWKSSNDQILYSYDNNDLLVISAVCFIITCLAIWFLTYLWQLDDIPKISSFPNADTITDIDKDSSFLSIGCAFVGITYYLGKLYITMPYVRDDLNSKTELVFRNIKLNVHSLRLNLLDQAGKLHQGYVDLVHRNPEDWNHEIHIKNGSQDFLRSGTAWYSLESDVPNTWGVFTIKSFDITLKIETDELIYKCFYPTIEKESILETHKRYEIETSYQNSY